MKTFPKFYQLQTRLTDQEFQQLFIDLVEGKEEEIKLWAKKMNEVLGNRAKVGDTIEARN